MEARQWCHTSLISGFGRKRQINLHKFKSILGCTRSIQKQIHVVGVHTSNPSTRELYAFNFSTKGKMRQKDTEVQSSFCTFPALVEVRVFYWIGCFAFLIFNLNLNICLWVFTIHATFDVQCLRYEFTKKLFVCGFSATSIGQSYMQLDLQANQLDFSFLYPAALPLNLLLRLLQN